MFSFKKEIKVCTHDGNFHADEVFACAVVSIWAKENKERIKIIRTRDKKLIDKADIVIDVGGLYNEKLNRFDHHQEGFNLMRDNQIPYASFGLVWKKYGKLICKNEEIVKMIEYKLVLPIDAHDNGVNLNQNIIDGVYDYTLSKDVVSLFRATWDEGIKNIDKNFSEILKVAIKIIEREIELSKSLIKGESEVLKFIEKQNEPEILVLDKYLPWERAVCDFRKIQTVVYPDFIGKNWCVEVARNNVMDYSSNRTFFPPNWCGKSNKDLVHATGVQDAIFCHKGGFFLTTQSKESAVELAKKAIKKV